MNIRLRQTVQTPTREEFEQVLRFRHTDRVQDHLSAGRVAVAGLGGLGSHVAFSLARVGVGHLHLIDFDVVELVNLNRQQYRICHIGMKKTEALAEQLEQINPYLDIRVDSVRVTEENLRELFVDDGIICEAFDQPEAKAMLVNGVLEYFPEKKLVCTSGMAGYYSSNEIRTRKRMKNCYLCGDEVHGLDSGSASGSVSGSVQGSASGSVSGSASASEIPGLMAPRVALCAAHEANMVVRLLMGEEDV